MSQTPEEIALERIRQAAESGVEELDLSNLGLTSLPPEIGQLTNLTKLSLWDNQLASLPPEIGQLTNLTDLPPLIVPITELVQRVQPVQAAPQAQLEPGDDILVHCAV